MSKLKTILLTIVGRLKKHMDAVFLTVGGILIPLGFYLKIDYPQVDNLATIGVLIGLAAWLLAYYIVKNKERRERLEKRTIREQEKQDREALYRLLADIHQELKEFNQGKR